MKIITVGMESKVYKSEKWLIQFDYSIKTFIMLNECYIALLEIPKGINFHRNIFCFDNEGTIIWQVEEQRMQRDNYGGVRILNEKLLAYCLSVETEIDVSTGKILNTDFVK